MKAVLADQFEPITGPDEAGIQEQIRVNILKVLNTKVGGGKQMAADNSYVNQLTEAALEERRHPHQYVFYHGTDETTGFLYDVITEFRKQLMASTHPDTVMLRGVDQAFAELMRETGQEGIGGLIKKFTQGEQGKIYNYQDNYQDLAISANVSLFGSLGTKGSETFRYFFDAYSSAPPNIQKFFKYFATQLSLHLSFERYEALLKEYTVCSHIKNGRLYQIFMGQEYVDQMAYAALPGGREFKTSESAAADAPVSSKIKHLLKDMREKPEHLSHHFSPQEAKDEEAHRNDYGRLQARLLMKPEWMMEPHIVQVKQYWRCPGLQAPYLTQLRELVREDLKQYLLSHRTPKEGALAPGGGVLLHQYKAAYERATGKPYIPSSQDPLEELKQLIEADDASGLQEWSKQYDIALLTKPFPRTDYRRGVGAQESLTPLELAFREKKFEAALYIGEKISSLIDAATAQRILAALNAPETKKELDSYLMKFGTFIKSLFENILKNKDNRLANHIYGFVVRKPFNREFMIFLIDQLTPEQLNTLTLGDQDNNLLLERVIEHSHSYLKNEDRLALIDALMEKGARIRRQFIVSFMDKATNAIPFDREFLIFLINHSTPEQLNQVSALRYDDLPLLERVIKMPLLAKEDKMALVQALMKKGAEVRPNFIRSLIDEAIKTRPLDREFLIFFINHGTLENNQALLNLIIGNMHGFDKKDKWVLVGALIEKGTKVAPRYVHTAIQIAPFDKEFVLLLINHLIPEELNTPAIGHGIHRLTLLERVIMDFFLNEIKLPLEDRLAVIQALRKKGATLSQDKIEEYQAYGISSQIIDALKSLPEDEEAKTAHLPDKDGDTPLHRAARDGDAEAIKKLLADGKAKATLLAQENIQNKDGRTPLHLAAEHRHAGVIKALLADAQAKAILLAPQNIQDRAAGLNPLSVAVTMENAKTVKALLKDEQARGALLHPGNISADDRSILNEFLEKSNTEISTLLRQAGYPESTQAPQVSEHAAAGHHQH